MTTKMNDKVCPLCGVKNNCMAHEKESCWCNEVKIPNELLELVPEDKKRKVCICLSCIQKFKGSGST